jgi:hypothetical protein
MLIAVGTVFVAVVSFFAPERAWIEAVSESFVPNGAVPLAVGWIGPRSRVANAALLGAVASVSMVVAGYLARPLLDGPYGILWSDLFYWSSVGAASGALLATFGWWLKPRASRSLTSWAVVACLFLALVQVGYLLYSGWGRVEVTTDSGIVAIGYSKADVVVSSLVLATFDCGPFSLP